MKRRKFFTGLFALLAAPAVPASEVWRYLRPRNQLAGDLPLDVENYILRKKIDYLNQFGGLRNLGLTSIEDIDKAVAAAQRWVNAASAKGPQYDFKSMFKKGQLCH